MTTAVAVGARRSGPANPGWAAAGLVVAVALLVGQEQVRRLEALACASLLRLLRIDGVDSLADVVTFPAQGRYVGFTVAAGCTAALLIVPFIVVAAILLVAGRVSLRRAGATVAVFATVIAMVNQVRLLVIAIAMRSWGYPDGFERSHVLMGSFVSTVGVAGGLLLFLRMVVPRQQKASDRRG